MQTSYLQNTVAFYSVILTHTKKGPPKKQDRDARGRLVLKQRIQGHTCFLMCNIHTWFNSAAVTQRTSCSAAWKPILNFSSLSWRYHCILQGINLCRCWGVFTFLTSARDFCCSCTVLKDSYSHILSYTLLHRNRRSKMLSFRGRRGSWKVGESIQRAIFAKLLSKPKPYRFPSDSCKKI